MNHERSTPSLSIARFGVQSDGIAAWEKEENSGIMSNGLTLARSSLMRKKYNLQYPNLKREEDFYQGSYFYDDRPSLLEGMSIGEAIISPTRQWALVIRRIMSDLKAAGLLHMLHGIVMNTGGGATKISNIGQGVVYNKEMSTPPPIFRLIQAASNEVWENMYSSFNCGIGIDIVGENNEKFITALMNSVWSTGLEIYILGECGSNHESGKKNIVRLDTPYGKYEYC